MRSFEPRGYIAVVTALLIATLITLLLFSVSTHTFLTRSDQQSEEHYLIAHTYAYSCLFAALQAYLSDSTYAPQNEDILLDSKNACTVEALSVSGSLIHVIIRTHSGFTYSRFLGTAEKNSNGTIQILSFLEATSTPP